MAKTPRKAAAKRTPVKPINTSDLPKGTTKRPEPDGDASASYRADMGEGIPPQKDHNLNPNRAK